MERVLGDKKTILILLGPALLVYSLVILVPVLGSLGYTFFAGNPIVGFEFTGTENIQRMLGDPAVWAALQFTLKYAIVLTIGQVGLGYALALLYIFVLKRASGVVRTLLFFPVVLPTVAVALLFQKLFETGQQDGPINALLNAFGLSSMDWFGTAGNAFMVVVIMDLWRSAGFYAVLLYTGLVDVPDDILEAARIDGATTGQLIRRIILPLSLPVLMSSLIFSINGTLKVFDSVLALTNGGPGTDTAPLTLYMFQTSFQYGEYGYGASIALMLTVVCLLFTLLIFRSARQDVHGR